MYKKLMLLGVILGWGTAMAAPPGGGMGKHECMILLFQIQSIGDQMEQISDDLLDYCHSGVRDTPEGWSSSECGAAWQQYFLLMNQRIEKQRTYDLQCN